MPPRYLRPLLLFEFLIALQVIYTCWSEVGGQYHLDLMYWPWKLGLPLAVAFLVVLISGDLVRANGAFTRKAKLYTALIVAIVATAGVVTYYYHLNEPTEEDTQDEQQTTITRAF